MTKISPLKKVGMGILGLIMLVSCSEEKNPYQELKRVDTYPKLIYSEEGNNKIVKGLREDYPCYNPIDIVSDFLEINGGGFTKKKPSLVNVPIYEPCPSKKIPTRQRGIEGITISS